jgi:hypothetical protein
LDSLLRIKTRLLPVLAASLHVRSQFLQVFGHLVQIEGELKAMVSHSLMDSRDLFVALGVRSLAMLGSSNGFVSGSAQLFNSLRMFFLESRSLLEERSKVLATFSTV